MAEAQEGRQGQIVTFYSFKGGTGRTMALANVAWILAASGKRVLVADWDLESPGLHRFFHPFISEDVRTVSGIIDMIREFYNYAKVPEEAKSGDAESEMSEYIRDSARVQRYAFSLDWKFPEGGTIDFLSAGLQNPVYVATLGALDWENFLTRWNGAPFLDALRADMKRNYDYVLIDSRTGLGDIADICTIHLPDTLVNCFTLSIQGIEGGAQVAHSVHDVYAAARHIRVLPVPMRLDSAEKAKLDAGYALAKRKFEGLPNGMSAQQRNAYWAEIAVPYQAFYAFEETLAVFGDPPGVPTSLLAAFERLTRHITEGKVTALATESMTENVRKRIMQRFTRNHPANVDEIVLDYAPEAEVWAEWVTKVLAEAGIRVHDLPSVSSVPPADESAENRILILVSPAYTTTAAQLLPANSGVLVLYLTEMQQLASFAGMPWASLANCDEQEAQARLLDLLDIQPGAFWDLRSSGQFRYPGSEPRIFEAPTRNTLFTGREEDMRHLRTELRSQGSAVVLQPVALHGLGGVGKTQLALEYAYRYKSDYDLVWWIDCDQPQYVDAALVDLGWQLQEKFGTGPTTGATGAEVAKVVVRQLGETKVPGRWLVIFDNADEPESIREFLPRGNGHVLVTSRDREWERETWALGIDVFDRGDSIKYLMKQVSWLTADEAEAISAATGDLPFAVAVAGAYLDQYRVPVDVYLQELELKGPRTLSVEVGGAQRSVAAIWDVSLDRLRDRSPVAYQLFEMCSVLAPDISLDLLYSKEMATILARNDPAFISEPVLTAQVLQELNRLALTEDDRKGRQIRVHRLLQLVGRSRMTDEHAHAVKEDVQRVLAAARPVGEVDDPDTWDRYRVIWPHLEVSGALGSTQPAVRQLVLDRVRYLWQRADFAGGMKMADEAERLWRELEGAESEFLRLLYLKANILRSLGRFNDSLELDRQVLERQTALLGEEHPQTLMTAGTIAADLRGLGQYRQALEADLVNYRKWTELVGADHERTLAAANNLAHSHRLNGNVQAALGLDEEILGRRRNILKPEHPHILFSQVALVRDLIEAGYYRAAVQRLEEVQPLIVRHLGPDSLEALDALTVQGIALRADGRFSESEQMLATAVRNTEHRFGLASRVTLSFRLSYGLTLLVLDRNPEATGIIRETLEYFQRTLGPDHPHRLICLIDLATALREGDRFAEALEVAEAAVDRLVVTLGDDHPYTLAAQVVKAVLLADTGKLQESRDLDEASLARFERVLGSRHPDTLRCRANLRLTQERLGESQAPDRRFLVADLCRVLGAEHPNVTIVREGRRLLRAVDPQPF
jgi:MinD-like ATPase involved in chromosome partitioning or flagellar assembly/tetratricopeptide (TPR) repeat protein